MNTKECPVCGGEGHLPVDEWEDGICHKGVGSEPCEECNGTGEVE